MSTDPGRTPGRGVAIVGRRVFASVYPVPVRRRAMRCVGLYLHLCVSTEMQPGLVLAPVRLAVRLRLKCCQTLYHVLRNLP